MKKKFNKYAISSDISSFAVKSVKYWEDIYIVKIDQSFACKSYDIPLEDESVDMVFCFAAAHHFVEHQKSLNEIKRILTPNGVCIYMYEPSCRKFIYPIAYRRVNKKRPEVPEDVLIYNNMKAYAASIGFKTTIDFYPSVTKRGPVETVYHYV